MNVLAHRTAVTPEIVLDPVTHALTLRGECYPENPVLFFGPVLAALEVHVQRPPAALEVTFRLSYVNSASTKALRRLLVRLDRLAREGGTAVTVRWEHERDDDGAVELGRDLADGLHGLDLVERPFDVLAAG